MSPLDRGARDLKISGWTSAEKSAVRPARTAAVLVAVLDQAEPEVVLTVRSRFLAQHPGQVSFPGGAASASDASGVSTALREAEEEIGLPASEVEPLGFLDRVDTVSDFRVLPVVALARPSAPFALDPGEVEDVFTVPLDRAVDVGAYEALEVEHDGRLRSVYSMDWQGRTIWGVTAQILRNLAGRMPPVTS